VPVGTVQKKSSVQIKRDLEQIQVCFETLVGTLTFAAQIVFVGLRCLNLKIENLLTVTSNDFAKFGDRKHSTTRKHNMTLY